MAGQPGDRVNAFLPYEAAEVPAAAHGPLAGLSFAVKDIYDVAGYRSGWGNPLRLAESPVQPESAPIVAAMLGAGAAFVGKTQTDELAFSLNGQNRHFPQPINPRAPGRITGGSSSGSAAATAAGICDFAIGSDTGGSVRAPASYCGLYGIRPTHGRVSLERTMPLAPSLDTAGYFADDPAVFGRVAPVFLGEDRRPARFSRLLRADDVFGLLQPDGEAEALRPAEARVAAALGLAPRAAMVAGEGLEAGYWAFRRIQAVEAWAAHGDWIESRDPEMTPGVRERFEFGRDVGADELASAQALRVRFRASLDALLGDDALLMLPTVPSIAPPSAISGDALQAFRERALQMLSIAGLAGLPQVSMPLAVFSGCPLGLSLIGPRGTDLALARLAARIGGG